MDLCVLVGSPLVRKGPHCGLAASWHRQVMVEKSTIYNGGPSAIRDTHATRAIASQEFAQLSSKSNQPHEGSRRDSRVSLIFIIRLVEF